MNGQWILDPRLGWTWVSYEPWGWMPYHFGTWLLSPDSGMGLGPGRARRAAPLASGRAVNWVRAGNQVGWVAMSPKRSRRRAGEPGAWGSIPGSLISQAE